MSELLEQLRKAVGESNVLAGESVRDDYTHDEALTTVPVVPVAVVMPGSTNEVSEVLRVASEHGVAVVAYSPFGHNDFPSPGSRAGQVLQKIAEAHQATPRQIALGFLTRETTVFAIPKASTAEHAAENAAAGNLVLERDEIAALDKAFARGAKPQGLPML